MARELYEIDCGDDEPLVMEVVRPGEIIFDDGFDPEAERAAIELGFTPSPCFVVWHAARIGQLDKALHWAACHGHSAATEALIAAGANVHSRNNYALRCASGRGHAVIVEHLLHGGADPHVLAKQALRWAARDGHDAVVRILRDWIKEHG